MEFNAIVFINRSCIQLLLFCSFEQMFQHEAELPEGERMEFVVIATPTCTHFAIALSALEVHLILFCIITFRMDSM